MRGKTAKLLRRVAKTNPYEIKNLDPNEERKYIVRQLSGSPTNKNYTVFLSPGFRFTYQQLKRFYKQNKFNTNDLRKELISDE